MNFNLKAIAGLERADDLGSGQGQTEPGWREVICTSREINCQGFPPILTLSNQEVSSDVRLSIQAPLPTFNLL